MMVNTAYESKIINGRTSTLTLSKPVNVFVLRAQQYEEGSSSRIDKRYNVIDKRYM